MFGILRRRSKPYIHAHWYVPLLEFRSDTQAFYQAIEDEFAARQIPEVSFERVDYHQAGWLSGRRTYLRLLRERVVTDVCSAPFGTGWYFSCRAATLPRRMAWWEVWLVLAGLIGLAVLYWQFYGLVGGAIVLGSTLVFLLLVMATARTWASLDELLIHIPVFGALYEFILRKDTYQQQDHRLIYADMVETIVRAKVHEFCTAGGVDEPEFRTVSSPQQILTEREQAKHAP